jgi:hypothetical protein
MFPRRTKTNVERRTVDVAGPDPIWSILQPGLDMQTTMGLSRVNTPDLRWGMAERVTHRDLGALQQFVGWAPTTAPKVANPSLPNSRTPNDQITAVLAANGTLRA